MPSARATPPTLFKALYLLLQFTEGVCIIEIAGYKAAVSAAARYFRPWRGTLKTTTLLYGEI